MSSPFPLLHSPSSPLPLTLPPTFPLLHSPNSPLPLTLPPAPSLCCILPTVHFPSPCLQSSFSRRTKRALPETVQSSKLTLSSTIITNAVPLTTCPQHHHHHLLLLLLLSISPWFSLQMINYEVYWLLGWRRRVVWQTGTNMRTQHTTHT